MAVFLLVWIEPSPAGWMIGVAVVALLWVSMVYAETEHTSLAVGPGI